MSDDVPPGEGVEKEVMEEKPRSILMGLLSQLKKGMDLHRVTLPTFVLEPRSMLERITDFMSHPELLLSVGTEEDPTQRFVMFVKYYLSGWHIRPKGVKKPYNPVLGEYFRCKWHFADNTEAFYIGEQVSHHPPVSAYFYASPKNKLFVEGELLPSSKFLGNSAATIMKGGTRFRFTHRPNEEYKVTMPNVYVRGLLFGTMTLELGDSCVITCEETGMLCELEFTTKGFFSGVYNGVKGKIKKNDDVLYNISGKWTEATYIQSTERGSKEELFFDPSTFPIHPKIVEPESAQGEFESRRLWSELTKCLLRNDIDAATDEKNKVEDAQRKERHQREESHEEHKLKFFIKADDEDSWKFKHYQELFDASSDVSTKKTEAYIFPNQK